MQRSLLHRMPSSVGKTVLVAVDLYRPNVNKFSFIVSVSRPASIFHIAEIHEQNVSSNDPELEIFHEAQFTDHNVCFFGGRRDPQRETDFVIPFQLDLHDAILRGRLAQDDTVKLTIDDIDALWEKARPDHRRRPNTAPSKGREMGK